MFLLDASDIARALEEARSALGAIDVPEGFRPLTLSAVQQIVHKCQMARTTSMYPGADPIPLAFRPTGDYVAAVAGLDTCWPIEHGTPDPTRLLTIELRPLAAGALQGRDYRPPGLTDVHDAAMADARELASWYFDPDTQRTWKACSPPPAPVPDDSPVEMLSARARRNIARCLRTELDRLPRAVLQDTILLSFDVDGTPTGLGFVPFPPEHHVCVRLGLDSDIDHVEPFLDRVRIRPSGKVVVLETVPI
jgi:hypothetical protein